MPKQALVRTDPINPGVYRHTKSGKLFRLLGEGFHSETVEETVKYHHLDDPDTEWYRPKQMWFEDVVVGGQRVPRFQWSHEHNR